MAELWDSQKQSLAALSDVRVTTTKLIRRVTRRQLDRDVVAEADADADAAETNVAAEVKVEPEGRAMVHTTADAQTAAAAAAAARRMGASMGRGVVDFICSPSAPTKPDSETGEPQQEPEDFSGGYSRCMAEDGVHPNAEGYSIWATHIGTALGDLLIKDQAVAEAAAAAAAAPRAVAP